MEIIKRMKNIFTGAAERGTTLVEAAVTVLILGGVVLGMILCMSSGVLAVQENDEQVTAQHLARTQMEYVKNYAYDASASTYPKISTPTGYSITVDVDAVPDATDDIQKITVIVNRDSAPVLTIQDYKVNR